MLFIIISAARRRYLTNRIFGFSTHLNLCTHGHAQNLYRHLGGSFDDRRTAHRVIVERTSFDMSPYVVLQQTRNHDLEQISAGISRLLPPHPTLPLGPPDRRISITKTTMDCSLTVSELNRLNRGRLNRYNLQTDRQTHKNTQIHKHCVRLD